MAPDATGGSPKDGEMLHSVRVVPRPFTSDQYEKCFFRLGLFLQGFNGALVLPDADLFVPYQNSVWSAFPKPPRYVPRFQYILTGCDLDPGRINKRSDVRPLKCTEL